MGYIYTFDIGSILFFSLTIFFYIQQRRVRDLPDQIYLVMLICGMIAVVFDCAAAAMEYAAASFPIWVLYAANMLFIAAMQACLPLFFIYVSVLTGLHYRATRKQHALVLSPYLFTMLLLVLSPFGTFGICYIDSMHIYQPGATHMMLYINTAIYIIASVTLLLRNYRVIQRAKRRVILFFVALLFLSIALQLAFPRYLLTASATALALTSMFYVLQSPVDRINPYTGAFSRMLLPSLLTDFHGRHRPYTLVQFSLHSFDEVIRLYGSQLGDALLRELTTHLQSAFPNGTVIYMDTWEFSIIVNAILSKTEVADMARRIPETISVGKVQIPIDVKLSAVPYDPAYGVTDTLVTADFLLRQIRLSPTDDVLYADESCRQRFAALLRLESAIDAIFEEGAPSLTYTPIRRPDGSVAAEDVSLYIAHAELQDVPHAELLQAIAQGGYVWRYYEKLFSLLKPQCTRYTAAFPVCVQLSSAACMQDDAASRLFDIITGAGFSPSAVTFFMQEANVASALPVLHGNIRHLAAFGFGFRLDAFAAGYTDLSQLTTLPVTTVKIDRSLLHDAKLGGRQLALLSGTLQILHDLGKAVVCAGVDSRSDFELSSAAGAELMQGAYWD